MPESTAPFALTWPILLGIGMLAIPLLFAAHWALGRLYLVYARRFCAKNGLQIIQWQYGPALDASGVKTEFTFFEIECVDSLQQPQSIGLVVGLFGIRKVLSATEEPI